MNSFLHDLQYGFRILRKNPGFAFMAACTLALGIGASTTMFGIINAVLLRPLPFHDPARLVRIYATQGSSSQGPSPLDVRDYAARNHTFEHMAVYDTWRKNVTATADSTEPEQLPVGLVPAEYFQILGVRPLFGRLFSAEENQWGRNFEVILSYEFWQTHFSGDRSILGKTVHINGEPYTIVGVMSNDIPDWWLEGRHGKTQLWTPFAPSATVWDETSRGQRDFSAIGRLKPGVNIVEASADLKAIAGNLATQYPLDRGISVELRLLSEDRIGKLRPVVLLLMGAVILILLIACSNVANLLLARNSGRAREVALRMALGAGKFTVMRQFTAESMAIGILAGLIGCVLAWWGCSTLARIHPAQLPQLALVGIDFRVLLFALALSIVSSVLFGTFPAWISSRLNLSESLKEGGRAKTSSYGRHQIRRALVASEMAFAVMLLIGSALLVQSLLRLREQDPGFRVDHILRSHLYLPVIQYSSAFQITNFVDQYADRVRALPGVLDATISAACPPDDQWIQNFTIDGRPVNGLEDLPSATLNVTDSHYLQTLGVPLLGGRGFTDSDGAASTPVALVNQSLVRRYFPGEDPIGKMIQLGLPREIASSGQSNDRLMIVGVVADAMNRGVALPTEPEIVGLYRQLPDLNFGFKNLLVRTTLDPLQLSTPVRQQLHSLDANLPFAEVSTMNEIMSAQTADRRYTTGLLVLFAVFGVGLSIVGVYGVISYVVTQRTGEIGLRMALGARRGDVLWLILKQGMGMAVIGTLVGISAAWALRQVVSGLVFGISPADPLTFISAAVLLIAFAGGASILPARRAASTDPVAALRHE
jgi:putative ABC transport system permease protein